MDCVALDEYVGNIDKPTRKHNLHDVQKLPVSISIATPKNKTIPSSILSMEPMNKNIFVISIGILYHIPHGFSN